VLLGRALNRSGAFPANAGTNIERYLGEQASREERRGVGARLWCTFGAGGLWFRESVSAISIVGSPETDTPVACPLAVRKEILAPACTDAQSFGYRYKKIAGDCFILEESN